MARLFHYQVDEAGLIDGIFAFVTEPRAAVRNSLPIVQELREGPNFLLPWDLMESMVLDGVDRREFVADWVRFAVGNLDSARVDRHRHSAGAGSRSEGNVDDA